MSELQATMEFCIELYKFYNVDLFQRGYYQIRTALRVSPKLPVKVEVNLPRAQAEYKKSESVFPACIVNGTGVSKTFQILYRNEEVLLDDVLTFRAHILVDSHKIEETLERADFQLVVELWFTDQNFGSDQHSSIACVSSRTLQLNFSPTRGLHYHLPVLFDYFHLAAVTLTIHASLVALHQPYINTPRSGKTWLGGSQRFNFRPPPQATMETVFFGQLNTNKCVSSGSSRIAHARHVHREVCSILLASFEALQAKLHEFMRLLPAWQQLRLEKADCMSRFTTLSELAKTIDGEEEFVALANSDIAQLCAENILLWQQFLEAFSCKEPVHQHLARLHHQLRVKRFAEAFFVIDNPRQSAGGCYDANYQSYLAVSEAVRRSRYLATLPPLPVSCAELDGELTTMPIIFEDQYQDVAEFARRRSVAGRKAGSDPFLSASTGDLEKESNPQQQKLGGGSLNAIAVSSAPAITPSTTPAQATTSLSANASSAPEDCSCGIVEILESRSQKIQQVVKSGRPPVAAMRPRQPMSGARVIPTSSAPNSATTSRDELLLAATFASVVKPSSMSPHAEGILRATLTLTPTPRPRPNDVVTDTNTLPGLRRSVPSHSKSLDQLKSGVHDRRSSPPSSIPPPIPPHGTQHIPPERPQPQGSSNSNGRSRNHMARSSSTQIRREHSEEEKSPVQQISRHKEKERIKNALRLDLQSTFPHENPRHHELPNLDPIINGHDHSSSDSNGQNSSDSTGLLSGCRRLETSVSVPYALSDTLRHSQSTMSVPAIYWRGITDLNSESMPNLAAQNPSSPHSSSPPTLPLSAPPIPSPSEKPFPIFPITNKIKAKKQDISSSASDITSEQSGWVSNSSRRSSRDVSSGQLSPEELILNNNNNNNNKNDSSSSNSKLIIENIEIDESVNSKILNGAQLKAKLEELKQLSTKNHNPQKQQQQQLQQQQQQQQLQQQKQQQQQQSQLQQKQTTPPPNTAQALLQFQAKHPYEEVPLPPPKQFRDPPLFAKPKEPVSLPGTLLQQARGPKLPPEQFRDPPRGQAKKIMPPPMEPFHVYESLTDFKAADLRELRSVRPDLLPGNTSTLPPKLPDKCANMAAMRHFADKTATLAGHKHVNLRPLIVEKKMHTSVRPQPIGAPADPVVIVQRSAVILQASPPRTSPSPKTERKTCSCPSDPLLPPPGAPSPQHPSCECYTEGKDGEERLRQKMNNSEDDVLNFLKHKEDFKRQMNFSGMLYSDFPTLASTLPYFHISDEYRIFSPEGLHLVVCVHGLDGNSADLRLVKTYLEMGMPGANLEFLMSERNQGDTFSDFDTMTDKLVAEILFHVGACSLNPAKISFIGHSLGNIIIRSAITRPQMKPLLSKLHTFLSLSGPHLGTLYNTSGLVNMGMWFMQKWKKSGSLLQLSLRDAADVRQTFLYRLSQKSNLHHFRNILLCGSSQDRYVPLHSSRVELCKAAVRDTSVQGAVYREMVHNILTPIINKPEVTFVRYDVHHALPNTANSLIGRAAHIAVLDSELFIEKFLVVTGLKYFR